MTPLKPITVKMDEELEDALIAIAAQRQEQTGERVTVSDVIRGMLQDGSNDILGSTVKRIDEDDPYKVKISEPYTPIGRKLLLPIKSGDIEDKSIERGMATKAWTITKRGAIPQASMESEKLDVPLFEIASEGVWHRREGFCKEDKIVASAKEAVSRQEDHEILNVISHAAPLDHFFTIDGDIKPENIINACEKIWEHELYVRNIVFNPSMTHVINDFVKDNCEFKQIYKQGVCDMNLRSCTMCPQDSIYVLSSPEMLGRIKIKSDIEVISSDDPRHLMFGRVVWESIGICVINDYCSAKIIAV